MKARSLHLRLMAGAMVAILAALAVAWLAMTWLFERHIERREAAELTRAALVLVSGLSLGPGGVPVAASRPVDSRFDAPAGGRYWQVGGGGGLRSRSLWDQALPVSAGAPSGDWRARVGPGPFGARLLFVERTVRPDRAGPQVLVQVATDEAALSAARREFGRDLAFFLAVLWAVLSVAALVQVRLGLRPLTQLRADLERLRRSPSARLPAGAPREIEPLVGAINALADAREADLARARRRAADLAHSLKTPLAALSAQSRRAREDGAPAAADGLDRAIAAVAAALESELARARAATARDGARDGHAAPAAVAERLVGVIERTDDGSRRAFEIDLPAELRLPLSEDALTEILGALIENAARHGRRRVRIAGSDGVLTIEDDGPGIDQGRAESALIRGGRLDEAGPGHGLGLAIVADLVEATEGAIVLDRSPMGGLRVRLSWLPAQRDPGP
ncbi:sensor histidine kinase [Phenylobacterium sp.]|uniref:sensor histidine kinase n=1 Tax=Phenylobacterium sp. TaxID=1871053 RepID=UPI002FCBB9B6